MKRYPGPGNGGLRFLRLTVHRSAPAEEKAKQTAKFNENRGGSPSPAALKGIKVSDPEVTLEFKR